MENWHHRHPKKEKVSRPEIEQPETKSLQKKPIDMTKHAFEKERVNKQVEKFNTTMKEIYGKLEQCKKEYKVLSQAVERKIIDKIYSLSDDFKACSNQSARDYGHGSKGKEAKLKDINDQLIEMNKDLDKLEYFYKRHKEINVTVQNIKSNIKNIEFLKPILNKFEGMLDFLHMGYNIYFNELENHYIDNIFIDENCEAKLLKLD